VEAADLPNLQRRQCLRLRGANAERECQDSQGLPHLSSLGFLCTGGCHDDEALRHQRRLSLHDR
jgi:hypothetical protein